MNNEELQSMKLIDYFLANESALSKLSREECKDVLRLASMTGDASRDEGVKGKCYDLLYACCFHMDLDIKELWNIYWILNRELFKNPRIPFSGHLDKVYRCVFLKVKELLPSTYAPYETTSSNLIVITTNQLLGLNHAPSRRILDYAYAFVTGLGKAVMIINSSGLNYYRCRCLAGSTEFNFEDSFNNIEYLNYRGISFPFRQIDAQMPDLYCIRETLDEIYALQPELVYNIGGAELVCDLCSEFTKTCSLPCSSDIPVTMSQYLLVGRKLKDADSERLDRLEDYQRTIGTVINYELPQMDSNPYKRSDYSLSDSDFVFGVVGQRLDTEINNAFIDLINSLLLASDVHFLIIGDVQNTERIRNAVAKPDRIHFTGFVSNGVLAVQLSDVYINPYRNGGGRSSFEALAQGVPVITFAYGDVYNTCGDEFAVKDEADFLETAARYVNDREYLEAQKLRARKQADRLSNIALTQKEVLDKMSIDVSQTSKMSK